MVVFSNNKTVVESFELHNTLCIIRFLQYYGGSHYCGYIVLNDKLSDHIVNNLNVHGGITFDEVVNGKYVYGFDCGHFGDNPRDQNIDFVRKELVSLVNQIKNRMMP